LRQQHEPGDDKQPDANGLALSSYRGAEAAGEAREEAQQDGVHRPTALRR
jgi:hypothetical protein